MLGAVPKPGSINYYVLQRLPCKKPLVTYLFKYFECAGDSGPQPVITWAQLASKPDASNNCVQNRPVVEVICFRFTGVSVGLPAFR